jgi:hypothetical protein
VANGHRLSENWRLILPPPIVPAMTFYATGAG